MSLSLKEQLINAGLVKAKQVKAIDKAKSKQQKLVRKGQAQIDDSLQQEIKAKQAAKELQDKKLNAEQQEKLQKKEIKAQIKQLIIGSKLPKITSEDYYNFVDHGKIKSIAVNALLREKLASGTLAITQFNGGYEIIPREVALKIKERNPHAIVLLNDKTSGDKSDADDPYAAYKIPDDLMW